MVTSKGDRSEKSDADVLRAQDIVPPYNTKDRQKQDSQKRETNKGKGTSSESKRKPSSKNMTSPPAGKGAKGSEDLPAKGTDAVEEVSQIPQFDLADEIMAEQRRITATRRKGPGKKIEAPSREQEVERQPILQDDRQMGGRPIGRTIRHPPVLSEQEGIIAEIVARDIEKLRNGDTSRSQG